MRKTGNAQLQTIAEFPAKSEHSRGQQCGVHTVLCSYQVGDPQARISHEIEEPLA